MSPISRQAPILFTFLACCVLSCSSMTSDHRTDPATTVSDTANPKKNDSFPEYEAIKIRDVEWRGHRYQIVSVNTEKASIRMKSALSTSGQIKNFSHLEEILIQEQRRLIFSTNGGMFHSDFKPVGLYIENHHTYSFLNIKNGSGNFFLKPNGVFAIHQNKPIVCDTTQWNLKFYGQDITFATQSGPMLVSNNIIHPAFAMNSTNHNIRSGVGVSLDHSVHFVLSLDPVKFYDLADFYKTYLKCPNALYLDGHISQNFIRGQNHKKMPSNFGVLIYVDKP